jgi:hypothetical protein
MCHEKLTPLEFIEMSLQEIEAAPKHGHPALPTDLRRSEMTAASLALRRSISFQRKQASIAPPYRRPSSKKFDGLRRSTRAIVCASVAAGVCALSLVSDIPREHKQYRESYTRAAALVAPIESRQKSKVLVDQSPLVPRGELDSLRSAAEVARIKQQRALDQERERADALARKLASLQAELEASRIVDSEEAVQAATTQIAQMRAFDQERDRADALARELASVRNELEAANRQIANLNTPVADAAPVLRVQKEVVDSSQARIAEHPFAPAARAVAPDVTPKITVRTDRPASTSGASRSPKHRLRMYRSGRLILATLTRCLNVSARELPSCRLKFAARTYRNHDARRLAASTMRRSESKRQNDDQIADNDLSKGASR